MRQRTTRTADSSSRSPVAAPVAVVDLFAGAGGFSVAATLAGVETRASVEIDPVASVTLKANVGSDHAG